MPPPPLFFFNSSKMLIAQVHENSKSFFSLEKKRLFYLDSAYTNLKKSLKVISKKIKMNQTIKDEQIKY